MPAKNRAVSYDDDFDNGGHITLDKALATKRELDKIRQEREKKRTQLQKDTDKKITELRKRIKQAADAHTKQLVTINKQQVDRLIEALEARDAIERSVQDKVAELQNEGADLAALLDRAYEHRIQKTQVVVKKDAEQLQSEGSDEAARPSKKVKLDNNRASTP